MISLTILMLLWITISSVFSFDFKSNALLAKQHFQVAEQEVVKWINMSMTFDQSAGQGLFPRQLQCRISGYVPCPNADGCCPAGGTCTPLGCCDAGKKQCGSGRHCYDPKTSICCDENGFGCPLDRDCVNGGCCPKGQQPCGYSHCYDPETEKCCKAEGRGCEKDLTCCGNECCGEAATCQDDGNCKPNTCTETSTYSSTRYATHVKTITKLREPDGEEEAPDFKCVPLTATGQSGDTLELGDDCGLTYQPADDASITPNATTSGSATLQPRATLDPTKCLYTSTSIVTYTVNTITTITTTVTRESPTVAFSCPPMSATNGVGDELSLDEECKLAFKPGEQTPSATAGGGRPDPSPSGDGSKVRVSRALGMVALFAMLLVHVM